MLNGSVLNPEAKSCNWCFVAVFFFVCVWFFKRQKKNSCLHHFERSVVPYLGPLLEIGSVLSCSVISIWYCTPPSLLHAPMTFFFLFFFLKCALILIVIWNMLSMPIDLKKKKTKLFPKIGVSSFFSPCWEEMANPEGKTFSPKAVFTFLSDFYALNFSFFSVESLV